MADSLNHGEMLFYNVSTMTKLLEQAIAKVRRLSAERQDEAAEVLLNMVEHDPHSLQLSDEQVGEVRQRLKSTSEGATHQEVHAFFQKLSG